MKPFLLAAFLCALLSTLTMAQIDTLKGAEEARLSDQLLNEVTILGQKARSLPGATQLLSSKQLAMLNQPNFNHVLRLVPGVNIRDEEGYGLRPNIGLRGTPVNRSAKITLMEDGVMIAPAPYADPAAYYFPTFLRINAVEVRKGSSQIKYGPYTIGGVINLLSTPIPESFQGFAQATYGSFHTNQQRIWIGDSHEHFDYLFEINRFATTGFKQLDGGGNTGFERRDFMSKLRWHTGQQAAIPQSVTLKLLNFTEEGNEAYLGLTYQDYKDNPWRRYAATQKDRISMNRSEVSLSHVILPAKGLSITTTAYYTYTFRDWARVNTVAGQALNNILANPIAHRNAYLVMTGQANGNVDYQSAERTFHTQGIQSTVQYHFTTHRLVHHVQAGVRYHKDQADRYATRSTYAMTNGVMVLTAAGIKGNAENQIRRASSIAAFLSYDLIFKNLKISPGVRCEKINLEFLNYGNGDNARLGTALRTATNQLTVLLPGIGINYDLTSEMNLFAGLHKGFSPPGMPSVTSTTGQARPEFATNYEIGYQLDKKHYALQLVAFLNNYSNILGSDMVSTGGMGTGNMFNAGKAQIKGIELTAHYDLLSIKGTNTDWHLPLRFVYTYTHATFGETFMGAGGDFGSGQISKGDFIPFVTPHQWAATLSLESNRFDFTAVARYVGTTRIKPGQRENIIVPSDNINFNDVNAIDKFLLIDLSGNYHFHKHLTAFFLINNLTNNKAIAANLPNGYRPNMPLSFNFGLKTNF